MNGSGADVLVLVARSSDVLAASAGAHARSLLTSIERDRLERLRTPQLREDFLAARVATRLAVLALHDCSVSARSMSDIVLVQRCSTCGGGHGRPRVRNGPPAEVSWSHSHGVVAAAAGHAPLGVDVESFSARPRRTNVLGAAGIGGSGTEAQVGWTRAEALVKAGVTSLAIALGWSLAGPARPTGVPLEEVAGESPQAPGESPQAPGGWVVTDRLDPWGPTSVVAAAPATALELPDVVHSCAGGPA